MLTFVDMKDRLASVVIAAVNRLFRDCAVTEPRFTFVDFLSKKSGPDPESFGTIYCDEQSRKEYLVNDLYVKGTKGPSFYAVYSIQEIESRPANEKHFDEQTFKKVVLLKRADIDVQENMIAFFAADCVKDGETFEDRRPLGTKDLGKARQINPAYTPA